MTAMRYIAQRPLKTGDRTVAAGDEIPEAAGWRNLKAYVANGSIVATPESGVQVSRIDALEARIEKLESQLGDDLVSGEMDPDGESEIFTGHLDADELGRWTRDQLEAMAADMGIEDAADKSAYPNKDTLIAKLVTIPVDVPASDDADEVD